MCVVFSLHFLCVSQSFPFSPFVGRLLPSFPSRPSPSLSLSSFENGKSFPFSFCAPPQEDLRRPPLLHFQPHVSLVEPYLPCPKVLPPLLRVVNLPAPRRLIGVLRPRLPMAVPFVRSPFPLDRAHFHPCHTSENGTLNLSGNLLPVPCSCHYRRTVLTVHFILSLYSPPTLIHHV